MGHAVGQTAYFRVVIRGLVDGSHPASRDLGS